MKRVLFAAYAAFFLTFAMTFIQCRMTATAGENIRAQSQNEPPAISAEVRMPAPLPAETVGPKTASVMTLSKAPYPAPGTVTVKNGDEVQKMDMQSYLIGVVAAEMPVSFEPEALKEVAKKSLERKTGARGLRAIMEQSMLDLMYQIPSDESIESCVVTKDVIDGTGEPIITRRESRAGRRRAI